MVILYFLLLLSSFFLFYKKRKKFAALLPLGGLILLGFLSGYRGFELSMLSVGQGDGLYLQADSGEHCMIDGGSSDVKGLYQYRIEPFLRAMGADHVDWWFVSHADNDHISALKEAMEEGLKIRHLVFSKYILQDEVFHELKGMAKGRGIPVHMMEPGEKLALGGTMITCLFPAEIDQKGDRNAQSLVLRVDEKDFSALLTGDISSEEEKAMLKRGVLQNVDFYKAAHHGSRYSNSEEFLEALSPRICGISCALKNRYGHPGEEALHNIEETGAALFETRFCGQVRLRLQKYNIAVWTAKPQEYSDTP
jgi:competence protein ComEC